MVLLDPGTMNDQRRYAQLPGVAGAEKEVIKGFQTLEYCHGLALRPDGRVHLLSDCNWRDPQYSAELNRVQDHMIENPTFWKTLLSVDLSLRSPGKTYVANTLRFFGPVPGLHHPAPANQSIDESELRDSQRSLGSLPLIVVSIAERPDPSQSTGAVHAEWLIKHDLDVNLTKISFHGKLITLSDTSHNIQFDQPEKTAQIVINLIREVRNSERPVSIVQQR
jgi:pimeloyl-ACP methyl ester carboxylesterase